MKAIEIEWDIDHKEDRALLPTEIEIPDGMEDEEDISDYLSDVTGFCHKGFRLQMEEKDMSLALEEGRGETIADGKIAAAMKCLMDNGIEPDEAENVLQAIGYILFNVELFPDAEKEASLPEQSQSLAFVFDDEIEVSDDCSKLEGYLWASSALVERLKTQVPPLEEDQFMENINFYPVYEPQTGRISLEGHYYLEDGHYARGRSFVLRLTPDETNRLRAAFEAYCLKREGRSCLAFLRDMKREHKPEHKALADKIQQAESSATSKCSGDSPVRETPLQTR